MSENHSRKEDKRCQKSKQAIKHSLLLLLHEKPISGITISELTSAANVNRKTFYNHYTSISDVLAELENDLLDRLFSFIDQNRQGQEEINPTGFFGRIFDAIKSNTADFRLLIQSGTHLNLIAGFRGRICSFFEDFLSHCEESDRAVMIYLLDYVCSGVVSILERWSFDCRDDELDDLAVISRRDDRRHGKKSERNGELENGFSQKSRGRYSMTLFFGRGEEWQHYSPQK